MANSKRIQVVFNQCDNFPTRENVYDKLVKAGADPTTGVIQLEQSIKDLSVTYTWIPPEEVYKNGRGS